MARYILYDSDYLSHHGIKGQRWGIMHGPPYPLGAKEHNRVVAGKSAKTVSSTTESVKNKNASSILDKSIANCRNKEMSGIAPEAVVALTYLTVYTSAVAATLIGEGIAKLKIEKDYKNDIKENRETNKSDIQKKIKGKHSADDDQRVINPDFSNAMDFGARVNCTMCSAAYELRRRGYDVVAQKTTKGRKPKDTATWFNLDNKQVSKFKTRRDFISALEKEPDGSRGLTFTAVSPFGSHHCMIWEKENGKVAIRDAQSNMKYDSVQTSVISLNGGGIPYRYMRTDNAEINWDLVRDAVRERN